MVEQQPKPRAVALEFAFDRLLTAKLKLVYDILVPDRVRILCSSKLTGGRDEGSGDLRACILGQTKGGEHDCQPDGGTGRVRQRAAARSAAGVGVRGRRL